MEVKLFEDEGKSAEHKFLLSSHQMAPTNLPFDLHLNRSSIAD